MNWHVYWGAWASATLFTFAAPEMWAVFTGQPEKKLSASAWALEDMLPGDPIAWRIIIAATAIMVIIHLTFGPRH